MNGKVWVAETSIADCKTTQPTAVEKQERKRGKITRRTTPTVEFHAENSSQRQRKQTYGTIESSSYSRLSLHLALNHTSTGECRARTEFCGWEGGSLHSASMVRRGTGEPASGQRSALQSRSGGRAYGKNRRNSVYEFKHLSDSTAYIQDYCTRCSFSALLLSRENGGSVDQSALNLVAPEFDKDEKKCEQKTLCKSRKGREEDAKYATCLVKSRGTYGKEPHHQDYLQQLANRLGVKESIQEGQLRYRLRPTPPSFTRKTRVAEDILISTQEDKSPSQSGDQTPSTEQQQSGEQVSRMESDAQKRPHTTNAAPTSLELPRIPPPSSDRNKNKTLSTSSVTKYLRISSRPRHSLSLGLGEEESAADVSSHDSLTTSETIQEEEEEVETNGVSEETDKGDQQKFLLEMSWRQRVLAEKAQALGLLSRDWAQTRLVKRTIGDWGTHPQPNTRANTRPCTRAHSRMGGERNSVATTRPCTRADTTYEREELRQTNSRATTYRLSQLKRSVDNDRTTSRPTTRENTGNEKLEKIRSIYEPTGSVRHKRSPSRSEQTSMGKRPVTRGGESNIASMAREKMRPATRQGKKVQRRLENDGSQYWNEVPRIGHYIISQSHTGTRTHLRPGTLSTAADEPAKSRTPQRVRLYSSHQLRHTTRESRHPSFGLSGYVHRQNGYSQSRKC